MPVLKVRKRKGDPESTLPAPEFQGFLQILLSDQPDLDFSFFLLDQPIRQEKSKDVLRYVLGFHSDRLNELQAELSETRQEQRTTREAARQIDEFLHRYGFASKATIEAEIDKLNDEEGKLDQEIENQGMTMSPLRPSPKRTDADRPAFRCHRIENGSDHRYRAAPKGAGSRSSRNFSR